MATRPASPARRHRGTRADLAGRAAEAGVAAHYARSGHAIRARRWRGRSGEIDLVAARDGEVIFVEVKTAADFDTAAARLGAAQLARLTRAAAEYLASLPQGQMTPCRFDVALVDGTGRIRILENALI